VYFSTLFNLKLAEKLKNEAGTELLQKTTSFRYDNNGNELRRSVEYIALYSKTNPKAYEAAVYNEDTTEPIHAVVEQTISQYDGFNRLKKTEIIKGGVKTAVEYAYNGDGLRVEKTVRRSDKGNTAETTSYLYDRQHVILETRGSESIRYARGINYIARIDNTDKLSYFMYNGHGDVVQTVSEDGEIENRYDYDIFGNPTLTVESYLNSIRYAGEFYDSETGLYYLRARYYDPYIGRFISEDSYWGEDSNPLSLNLYTYAHNNPIKYIDPAGHSAYEQGKQQVANQVKNESQQSLKNKLNAQRSSYESAVKNNDKEGAALYKGRMDALNDMMSSSGSSSSSGGRSSGSSSSGSGSGSSRSNSSSRSVEDEIRRKAEVQIAAALTGRENAQSLINMIEAQKLSYKTAEAGSRMDEAELYHQRAELLRERLYEVERRNGRDISDIVNARGNDAGTWESYTLAVTYENAAKDGVFDERERVQILNRLIELNMSKATGQNYRVKNSDELNVTKLQIKQNSDATGEWKEIYNSNKIVFASYDRINDGGSGVTQGTGNPAAYIFYALSDSHNLGFEDRAKADAERWKKAMGTDAILIPVTSEKEFAKYWSEMGKNGEKVQYVGLYFHSNPHNLFINTDNDEYITSFESGYARGDSGPEAMTINSLDKKTIENLYLYSCNSGNLSHLDDNLAVSFLKNQDVKNVYAWDGGMKWSRDGQYTRLAYDQEYFDSWLNEGEKRKASGMSRFYNDENGNMKHSVVEPVKKEWQWFRRFNLWETQYK